MFLSHRVIPILLAGFLLAACETGVENSSSSSEEPPYFPRSTKSEEARKYMDEGDRADGRGYFVEAARAYRRAVASDSAYGYAYLRVAQTGNSLDEFRTNLTRAVAFAKTGNGIEQGLIETQRRAFEQNVAGAIALAESMAVAHPENVRLMGNLASWQSNNGKIPESRATAERALKLAPRSGLVNLAVAQTYILQPPDLVRADSLTQVGLKLWPNEPRSYDVLGTLRRSQGRLEDAAAAYTRRIELAPDQDAGHGQRAHTYAFLGKYDLARADYDQASRRAKDNRPAFWARARAYLPALAGDPKTSVQELRELLTAIDGMGVPDVEGEKINTLGEIMAIASLSEQHDAADSAFRQYSELIRAAGKRVGTPEFIKNGEGFLAITAARLLARKGDFDAAEKKLGEGMKLLETNKSPTKYWGVYAVRGEIALKQKRYADVLANFDKGDPRQIVNIYHRAIALDEMGRKDEAKALFKRVAEFNFSQAGYAVVRGDAVRRAK